MNLIAFFAELQRIDQSYHDSLLDFKLLQCDTERDSHHIYYELITKSGMHLYNDDLLKMLLIALEYQPFIYLNHKYVPDTSLKLNYLGPNSEGIYLGCISIPIYLSPLVVRTDLSKVIAAYNSELYLIKRKERIQFLKDCGYLTEMRTTDEFSL